MTLPATKARTKLTTREHPRPSEIDRSRLQRVSSFQAAPIEWTNNVPTMPTTLRAASGEIIFGRLRWWWRRAPR